MDFKDEIKLFGDRVEKLKDQIQTEEATKNAFIMHFKSPNFPAPVKRYFNGI